MSETIFCPFWKILNCIGVKNGLKLQSARIGKCHNFNVSWISGGFSGWRQDENPVPIWSLKSGILNTTSFTYDKTFRGVGSAEEGQSRRKAKMSAQRDGELGTGADPRIPPYQKKTYLKFYKNVKNNRPTLWYNIGHIVVC